MRDRGPIVFIGLSACSALFAAAAAGLSIAREGLGSDAAAWVQASGSIAAIASAIWLFRSNARLKRRERRTEKEEIAWGVRFALTNALLEVRGIIAELSNENLLNEENPECHWLLRIENVRNVLSVFAERTDHIHPAMNHIASNGMLLVSQLEDDVRKAIEYIERNRRPLATIVESIMRYGFALDKLLEEFDARMRGIVLALNENDDLFPLKSSTDRRLKS